MFGWLGNESNWNRLSVQRRIQKRKKLQIGKIKFGEFRQNESVEVHFKFRIPDSGSYRRALVGWLSICVLQICKKHFSMLSLINQCQKLSGMSYD